MYTAVDTISFWYSFRSLASKGFPSGYSKSVCVRLHSENSEPTMFSQTTPDEKKPTPPPCRWPALITLPTLAKFQIVWRRICDVVLFPSSCLVEHTLTAVCVLPSISLIVNTKNIRAYCDHLNVRLFSTRLASFRSQAGTLWRECRASSLVR